jgi:hypothetical protein
MQLLMPSVVHQQLRDVACTHFGVIAGCSAVWIPEHSDGSKASLAHARVPLPSKGGSQPARKNFWKARVAVGTVHMTLAIQVRRFKPTKMRPSARSGLHRL